jgi:hypothetical protein
MYVWLSKKSKKRITDLSRNDFTVLVNYRVHKEKLKKLKRNFIRWTFLICHIRKRKQSSSCNQRGSCQLIELVRMATKWRSTTAHASTGNVTPAHVWRRSIFALIIGWSVLVFHLQPPSAFFTLFLLLGLRVDFNRMVWTRTWNFKANSRGLEFIDARSCS